MLNKDRPRKAKILHDFSCVQRCVHTHVAQEKGDKREERVSVTEKETGEGNGKENSQST